MGISNIASNLRPGICTFATRPTTPYEGQVIYETDTNRVLVWDNAAWVMIADTDQPPGLQLVKTQTIGSAVSSVVVSDVFSSEYDNYLITVNGESHSTARQDLTMTLGASSTGYYSQIVYGSYGNTAQAGNTNNGSAWKWVGSCLTDSIAANITVMNPNRAEFTRYSAPWWADVDAGIASGIHTVATAYTSFTIAPASGTITGGTIRVYGYRN